MEMGFNAAPPKIQRPRQAKKSKLIKGLPITEHEFDMMLQNTATVVGVNAASSWEYYLKGLWWSGLRLTESLELLWDDDSKLHVVFVGDDVMLRIPAELKEGNKDRLLTIAPEFAEFLLRTAQDHQIGLVFHPKAKRVHGERLTEDRIPRVVSNIGEAANVVVDNVSMKYASAHDLRRSFGERCASRVMPQELMELMRHESIEITLKYYVERNAQRTAKLLRKAYEDSKRKNGNGR